MRHLKRFFPVMLMFICLALAGCGSSGSGSSVPDPLAGTGGNTGSGTPGTGVSGSGGVIMFTSAASLVQPGQTNMLEPYSKEVDPEKIPGVSVLQLFPFKLTDSDGNPRKGVPVTLTTYSINPTRNPLDVSIDFLVPEYIGGVEVAPNPDLTNHNQQTITTDSAGMGIFNLTLEIASPPPCSFTARTIVFKARTNDTIPITAYVGREYGLTTPDSIICTGSP